jgi:DNA repair exonuclease SbcCD ATPase subunit
MDNIQKSPDVPGAEGGVKPDPVKLREQAKSLQESIEKAEEEIKGLERENLDSQPLLDKAVDDYNKVVKKYNIGARISRFLWMGGIAGGLAALSLSQPLLLIPLGAAGLSRIYLSSVDKKLTAERGKMESMKGDMSRRTLKGDIQRSKLELYRTQLEIIKPQLDTLDMADALSRPKGGASSEIRHSDDDSFVIIGGLKMAKRKFPGALEPIGADHQSKAEGESKNTG